MEWLSLWHNFIQQSPSTGSVQVQILLAACQGFAMTSISDNWPRLEIRFIAPRRSTIPQKQFIWLAVVVPAGVSLKTLSPEAVSSWLYLLIFTWFVKSRLRWLWHYYHIVIFKGFTWDSFNIVPNQIKNFVWWFFMCSPLICLFQLQSYKKPLFSLYLIFT